MNPFLYCYEKECFFFESIWKQMKNAPQHLLSDLEEQALVKILTLLLPL
jgi:hypothetical protein